MVIIAAAIPYPANAQIESGLVAYYPLDVNVMNRFNQPESSQYFDGLYEFTIIDQDKLVPGDVFSVSFWVKLSGRNEKLQYFIECRDFGIWQYKDRIGFAVSHPETGSAAGSIPSFDEWTHFLGTFDGTHIRIYINGRLTDTTYHPGTFSGSDQKLIFGYSQLSYWKGTLDDIRIYNRVLTRNEIAEISDAMNGIQIRPTSSQTYDQEMNISLD